MPDMTNCIALVTGAASGIGLATAEALAREGADVALLSRPGDDLDGAQDRVKQHGGRVVTVAADVADPEAVRVAFERVESELGPVDAVHNNAGISIVSALTETTDEVFRRLVDTNLAGSFYVLREAARVMQSRRAGAIVNTASELAIIGQAGYVAYTATKGGILAMTRSAAAELSSWGIRVNAVCPGPIYTPFHEKRNQALGRTFQQYQDDAAKGTLLRRHGTPDEVAACILFLASDDASYVTGTLLFVDGGYTAM